MVETIYKILSFDLDFLCTCFIIILFICTFYRSIILLNLRAVIASIILILFILHAIMALLLKNGSLDIISDIIFSFFYLIITIREFKFIKKVMK